MLFAGSFFARRYDPIHGLAIYHQPTGGSRSLEEALRRAIDAALTACPTDEGWGQHHVAIMRLGPGLVTKSEVVYEHLIDPNWNKPDEWPDLLIDQAQDD